MSNRRKIRKPAGTVLSQQRAQAIGKPAGTVLSQQEVKAIEELAGSALSQQVVQAIESAMQYLEMARSTIPEPGSQIRFAVVHIDVMREALKMIEDGKRISDGFSIFFAGDCVGADRRWEGTYCMRNGRAIGIAYLDFNRDLHVYVDPLYRRRGIATTLMIGLEMTFGHHLDYAKQSYSEDGLEFFPAYWRRGSPSSPVARAVSVAA